MNVYNCKLIYVGESLLFRLWVSKRLTLKTLYLFNTIIQTHVLLTHVTIYLHVWNINHRPTQWSAKWGVYRVHSVILCWTIFVVLFFSCCLMIESTYFYKLFHYYCTCVYFIWLLMLSRLYQLHNTQIIIIIDM